VSDADLAKVCADLYDAPAGAPGTYEVQGIVFSVAEVAGTMVVCFRGSLSREDWLDDFNALPVFDNDIGFVHRGFYEGMRAAFAAIEPLLGTKPILVTGHSLGGARARIFAGLAIAARLPLARVVTFGAPRPGFINLRRLIEKTGVPHVSYRNRNDPVPLVPIPIPFFPWEHTEDAWITVDAAPADDDIEPLRDHHIALYQQGVLQLPPQIAQ
jgi:predicted lipase